MGSLPLVPTVTGVPALGERAGRAASRSAPSAGGAAGAGAARGASQRGPDPGDTIPVRAPASRRDAATIAAARALRSNLPRRGGRIGLAALSPRTAGCGNLSPVRTTQFALSLLSG